MVPKKRTDYYLEELKNLQFKKEIVGIIVLAVAFFLYLGNKYVATTGIVGQFVFGNILDVFIGQGKYLLPHFFAITGLIILFGSSFTREKFRVPGIVYGFIVYLIFLELQYGMATTAFLIKPYTGHPGGTIGYILTFLMRKAFGFNGLKIILIASVLISLLLIFNITLFEVVTIIANALGNGFRLLISLFRKEEDPIMETRKENKIPKEKKKPELKRIEHPKSIEPQEVIMNMSHKDAIDGEGDKKAMVGLDKHRSQSLETSEEEFLLPPLKLLNDVKINKDSLRKLEKEIKEIIGKLEETLESFKVSARVVATYQGPTVTRYELQPGFGVKVSKIVNLADDIALNLAAKGVRIEAPVPGKSVVGIEIPNSTTQIVNLLPLVKDEKFLYSSSALNIVLGVDLEGKSVYCDLAKMPHILIAGATGSGKSVCINALIVSLLLRNNPSSVRMILIDPKKVELSVYDDIPHLIAPVVTDAKVAAVTLRWCVREMEKRYEELAALGVRNIEGYNEKIDGMIKDRDKMSPEVAADYFVPKKHPYIVVIIDELADLMLAVASEVETSIARIAQMARAVGIHLVIATQRPSVDVITGLIKANVPSRTSFAVSSQIDSRTILDAMGAEKLLGKGDMLYKPIGSMRPVRAQGVFLSDKEVHAIVKFVKAQGQPEYLQEVVDLKPEDLEDLKKSSMGDSPDGYDELYEEARDLVVNNKVTSISYIQRKLRIGYNRAARIMEQLEESGIVSSPDADGKGRQILI